MKQFIVEAKPYGKRILIAIGLPKDKLLQQVKKKRLRKGIYNEINKDNVPDKHNNGTTYLDTNYGNSVIYMNEWVKLGLTKKQIKLLAVLVHELLHAEISIMKNVGINVMREDEPLTYSVEELLVKILTKLK